VFYMDVAKVDRDVAHVATVIHVCCKRLFQIFHLFFQTYVASVFIWMLYMFHTYLASVFFSMLHIFCNGFFKCFYNVSYACFKYFICLQTMLQMFHLDVSKVDRVLLLGTHLPACCSCRGTDDRVQASRHGKRRGHKWSPRGGR
jgi:hypothetical protein